MPYNTFKTLEIKNLGLITCAQGLAAMEAEHRRLVQDPDAQPCLIIMEHFPVLTMGQRQSLGDLKTAENLLQSHNLHLVPTDRGGRLTAHEPGQVVFYPVVRVHSLLPSQFVHFLENVVISICNQYGVPAHPHAHQPGVWVQNRKLASLGVRIQNHVSKHGVAINVCNTLQTFQHITPCGLTENPMTTLHQEWQRTGQTTPEPNPATVALQIANHFIYTWKHAQTCGNSSVG